MAQLGAAELVGPNRLAFYWVNGTFQGETKRVGVLAAVNGDMKQTFVEMTVTRPTCDWFKLIPSGVSFCPGNYIKPGEWLAAHVRAGAGTTEKPGMQWNAQVTATVAGGQAGFIQLIRTNCVRRLTNGKTETYSTNGAFVLDDPVDVSPGGIFYGTERTIGNAKQILFDSNAFADSPGIRLRDNMNAASADLAFEVCVMYRPPGAGCIWVPLAKGTWAFAASAVRTDSPPTLFDWAVRPLPGISHVDGKDTTAFPEWNDDGDNFDWR